MWGIAGSTSRARQTPLSPRVLTEQNRRSPRKQHQAAHPIGPCVAKVRRILTINGPGILRQMLGTSEARP